MKRRWPLTTRLTLWYTLLSAALLLGLAGFVFRAVNLHFEELDRDTLQDKIHLVQDIWGSAATPADVQRRLDDALRNHPGLFVRIDHADGRVLYTSVTFRLPPDLLQAPAAQPDTAPLAWQADGHTYLALSAPAPEHPGLGRAWRVWAVMDNLHHAHFLQSLRTALGGYVALAAGLSGLLGWWAARAGLAPLRAMKARAQAVTTAHQLDERMPVDTVPVEMADLAQSLNDMLARLQSDFQRLSAFSSDLAHELRTPISNLLTQTQVALSQQRTAVDYRDILASNAEEFQRLARMVSDMLLLAKAEHGLLLPRTEHIDLVAEVQALFDFYDALAEEQGIRLQLAGSAQVTGDRLMLRRAISNLLSNALRHTPPEGTVAVTLASSAQAVTLSVSNPGEPIDPALLPRLFDRFFRADPARTHADTDGVGLGLAITKAIVEAHGGTVGVTSTQGHTCFTLTLPLPC